MSIKVRWKFTDLETDEIVFLPINPREMNTPTFPRNMQYAWGSKTGVDRIRGIDSASDAPPSWTFTGVILTKAHYDLLLAWAGRSSMIRVDDHTGRAFKMMIQKYDPVERLPTKRRPWRADYTMNCLLLEELDA